MLRNSIFCSSSPPARPLAAPRLLYIQTANSKAPSLEPSDIENTVDWLGCPTPLETCRHQLALYENEFEELTLQLRQERERIFKLVEMHAEAVRQRDEAMATLREKAAETAKIRRKMYDLRTSENAYKKEAEKLREINAILTARR